MSLEVYDVTTVMDDLEMSKRLHGRRQIFSSVDEVTDENVIEVLNKALPIHQLNRMEEIYLKKYERGIQPILARTKQYNAEINNKIVVNIASQIVTFKTSEFAGEPIMYVSRSNGLRGLESSEPPEGVTLPEKVAQINSMMLTEGKQTKDLKLAHEMFTCGVGYRLTIHDSGNKDADYLDDAPFEIYVPDSENTFVVRRSDVTKRVLMGVTYVFLGENLTNPEYTVYTPNVKYTIAATNGSALEITKREQHNFGMVTLTEYPCNPNYMGAFEPVVPLLDAINLTQSNRLDGIEQFIQALMVFDGVDISREDFLELKDLGAIKLPNTAGTGNGGRKLYYLNEQLDQSQTQTLVNDMYKTILQIVGMPSQGDGNTSDSSNNGAMILKNGWWHAEARMLETQSMWREAETEFLKVVLKICADNHVLEDIKLSDLEPKFWRQSYEDLLVKTQSFSNLRTSGMPAIQAFTFSHLSRDPESDAMVYDEYQQKLADELDRLNGVTEGIPLDENDTVNPTNPDGIKAQAEGEETSGGGGGSGGREQGKWAICPVCGKRFQKRDDKQIYDSLSCSNKARRDNGVGFRR